MTQHDYTIADAPGLPVRLDLQEALKSLADCNAGNLAPATTYAGMLWLDTSVLPDGQLRMRNQANSAWIAIAGFPAKASSAEVIAGTDDLKYATPKGIADADAAWGQSRRNRFVNPAMQHSLEALGAAVTTSTTPWPVEQTHHQWNGGAHTLQQVSSTTPNGSLKRLRWTVNTAVASLAAGNYGMIYQPIIGNRINDFFFGTASAKRVIVRFGWRSPAGTYTFSIHNSANNRCYATTFTIAAGQANTDVEITLVIPGDVTGTWLTDSGIGFWCWWGIAAGSTYAVGTLNTWGTANVVQLPGGTNGFATAGNVFELFDIGLYLDTFGDGIPPLWEMPDPILELWNCYHYYQDNYWVITHQICTNGNTYYTIGYGPVDMRDVPTAWPATSQAFQACPNAPGSFTYFTARCMREGRVANATSAIYYETSFAANARVG